MINKMSNKMINKMSNKMINKMIQATTGIEATTVLWSNNNYDLAADVSTCFK